MGKYFGTDGFRGRVNHDLTSMHAYKIGRFLGWYYNDLKKGVGSERAKIVIGKDTRRSSYMLEYSVAAGITASGADAYLLHVTTTPSVAYITKTENFDCGIMISASHNPYYDNGIKLLNRFGEKMEDEVIDLVEKYLGSADSDDTLPYAIDSEIGRTVDFVAGRNRYMGYLISLGKYSFKGIRVALDCANGSGYSIAPSVFSAMGATVSVINDQPNGVNINSGCGSTNIDVLAKYVKDNALDIGFAYDGDADRCLCVDEKGQVLTGDHILYVCGLYMKERGALVGDKVVATVMSNMGLDKALEKHGVSVDKTAVGDKYVYDHMSNNGYKLGGEQSGHIIFSKYATTGDGILTSLMIMEAMIASKKKLSELHKDFAFYPQLVVNLRVFDKKAVTDNENVKKHVTEVNEALSGDGRLLIRASGTEPVIRIMCEAKTNELCDEYVRQTECLIKEMGLVK